MSTIDLGTLSLEVEDHYYMLRRSKSCEEPCKSVKIFQKNDSQIMPMNTDKKKKIHKLELRKSLSMELEQTDEKETVKSRIIKHPSETEILKLEEFQSISNSNSKDTVVVDIYVKVPIKN